MPMVTNDQKKGGVIAVVCEMVMFPFALQAQPFCGTFDTMILSAVASCRPNPMYLASR